MEAMAAARAMLSPQGASADACMLISFGRFREDVMKRLFAAVAILTLTFTGAALAQAPAPITRTPLQKFDVPGTNYETVIGIAAIVPNVSIGKHTHPGPESGYMLEGAMTLLVDGQPPKELKAGDSYVVPPGAAHDARTGAAGAKVIATYVVEKGKPLASPVQ
jgi:quercetin dioxygenase-like cupin family protein